MTETKWCNVGSMADWCATQPTPLFMSGKHEEINAESGNLCRRWLTICLKTCRFMLSNSMRITNGFG